MSLLTVAAAEECGYLTRPRPKNSEMTKRTRNTKNKTLAIPAAVPAIPPKPRTAAIMAITKNVMAQLNIRFLSVDAEPASLPLVVKKRVHQPGGSPIRQSTEIH